MEVTRWNSIFTLLTACVCVAMIACSREQTPLPVSTPAGPDTTVAPSSLDVRVIDAEGYQRFLEFNRGKVILVDFWATWCSACVELLPHHVALAERFADRGLVVATVSMDDPEQQAAVRAVLARRAAPLVHFVAQGGQPNQPETDPFHVFTIPGGALPHLKLYDRGGALRRTFDARAEVVQPEAIDQAVEQLLNESP